MKKHIHSSMINLDELNTKYPKETFYNGIFFRSKTEARWAALFDDLKIEYVYEPKLFKFEDGIQYAPDFRLPDLNTWIEVKGQFPTKEEEDKIKALSLVTNDLIFIFIGFPTADKFQSQYSDRYVWEAAGIEILTAVNGKVFSILGGFTVNHVLLALFELLPAGISGDEFHLLSAHLACLVRRQCKELTAVDNIEYMKANRILMKRCKQGGWVRRDTRN